MTKEEAKGNLIHALRWNDIPKKEALDMAIKALEQQPCEDAISRQAAIDFINAGHLINPNEPRWSDNEVVNFLKSRPSVNPQEPKTDTWSIKDVADAFEKHGLIKEQEPMREFTEEEAKAYSKALDKMYKSTGFNVFNEPCTDAVSRQAVMDCIDGYSQMIIRPIEFKECIDKLPPVIPQPKTGHWIQTNEFFINQDGQFIYKFICSECKSLSYFRKSNKKAIGANVCPNCGAKMQKAERKDNE